MIENVKKMINQIVKEKKSLTATELICELKKQGVELNKLQIMQYLGSMDNLQKKIN